MYLTTFKLKEAPFQPNPDSRFLYPSRAHARQGVSGVGGFRRR